MTRKKLKVTFKNSVDFRLLKYRKGTAGCPLLFCRDALNELGTNSYSIAVNDAEYNGSIWTKCRRNVNFFGKCFTRIGKSITVKIYGYL